MDIAAVVSDKNVFVSATGFHGQLTGEVRSVGLLLLSNILYFD